MNKTKKVLIVDDSVTTRDYISTFLTEAGYTCQQAKNGLEALSLIKKEHFDCFVIDLLMPEMNGFELLNTLRDSKNNTPSIVVTADIQQEVKKECVSLGANDFINKPISDPGILIQSVQKAIKA